MLLGDLGLRYKLPTVLRLLEASGDVAAPDAVIRISDGDCESSEMPIVVGSLAELSDAFVIGLRQVGRGYWIGHAACRRVRDLKRALETHIGLVVDFQPTSAGSRCDFVFDGDALQFVQAKLESFAQSARDGAGSWLQIASHDPDLNVGVFDATASLAELTNDLAIKFAVLMPFTRHCPFPCVLVKDVFVGNIDPFDGSDGWAGWGLVELTGARDNARARVLCLVDAPTWGTLSKSAVSSDSQPVRCTLGDNEGSAVDQAPRPRFDVLLTAIPLACAEGSAPFEIHAVREAEHDDSELLRQRINAVLRTLTYREREILKLRFGIGDGYVYTPEECARIFKVTPEEIQAVETEAVRKLQHPVRRELLQDFLDQWTLGSRDRG